MWFNRRYYPIFELGVAEAQKIRHRIDAIALRRQLPAWYVRWSYIGLLPLFIWPIVFICSLFLFENPDHLLVTTGIFLLLNSYPLWLLGLMLLGFSMFHVVKPVAILLPLLPCMALLYLMGILIFGPA